MSLVEETRWMDATEQAALVASAQVHPTELVDAAIARIETDDKALNAVVMHWFEHARSVAQATSPADDRPFAGVPFLIKDLWTRYEGMPCSQGNAAVKDAAPVANGDDNIVAAFKRAGLITLGRSASPELGSLPITETAAWGPTRNPWDVQRTPGGSSGGAAAAVAAGLVPIAHASDGGGSIRIPASCCGLVGLKTSRGRVSMGPIRSETGLAVEFAVTRSVRDAARLLDAVAGPGVGDLVVAPPPLLPYSEAIQRPPGRLRIGLLDHHPVAGNTIDSTAVDAVRHGAALLASFGHTVELGYPSALGDPGVAKRFSALWSATRSRAIDYLAEQLGRELTEHDLEPHNWAMYQFVLRNSAVDLSRAEAAAERFARDVQSWWGEGWDLLVTPTLGTPPLEIGALNFVDDPGAANSLAGQFVPFTPAYNVSGQPAISVPLYWSESGLPIGVQLVAAYGREDLLLSVAAQLEAAQPWVDRHPPIGS